MLYNQMCINKLYLKTGFVASEDKMSPHTPSHHDAYIIYIFLDIYGLVKFLIYLCKELLDILLAAGVTVVEVGLAQVGTTATARLKGVTVECWVSTRLARTAACKHLKEICI